MRTASLVVALLVALAARAQDGTTYQIKIKHTPDAGQSAVVKETSTNKLTTVVTDEAGKVLNRENKQTREEVEYTLTVTKKDGDKAVKYQRAYKKAAEIQSDKRTSLPYEGRIVLYERKGDKVEVRVDGKPELSEKDLAKLTTRANSPGQDKLDELLLPGKAVKVGESWTLADKGLKALDGLDSEKVVVKKLEGKGKLAKVFRKGSQTWGVIELDILVVVEKAGDLTFIRPMATRMKYIVETAIDGSSTAGRMRGDATVEGTAKTQAGGMNILIDMRTETANSVERAEKK